VISFVVPAHNEERLIGAALAAIQAAAEALGRPYEIVVVDDASTDRTAQIAHEHGVRVVPVSLRHIAAVRNAGAAAAVGTFLIFVDADTIVNARVVAAAVQAMESGVVGGGSMVDWEGPMPRWGRVIEVITLAWMRWFRLAAGCFMFCTRAAFEAVGGFDQMQFAAEELYFSRSLKRVGRFVILREAVLTSGRKFRTFTPWELTRMLFGLGWLPWRGLRDRTRLALWYGERRHDDEVR
jgi:cellulose synthase/poly-beta-1,6-N-acetylglucosamine synthase-like glycosyltransferase